MIAVEIGPQDIAENQLRVGYLPQQKVADSLFATGADQQVGIGYVGGRQIAGETLGIDVVGRLRDKYADEPGGIDQYS